MASSGSSPLKTLFKLLLAGIGFGSCLCCCGLGMLGRLADLDVRAPLPGFPSSVRVVDLGAVILPPGTPPQGSRDYEWRAEGISPPQHFISYKLSEELAGELEAGHVALGRRLRYRSLGNERFTYNAPAGCTADMRCIYEELMRTNAEPVRVLGDRFVTSIRERGLDAAQATQLIGIRTAEDVPGRLKTDGCCARRRLRDWACAIGWEGAERGAQEESAARRRFHSCGSSSPMRESGCVCTRSSMSARYASGLTSLASQVATSA